MITPVFTCLLLTPVAFAGLGLAGQVRQQELDRALIAAIKRNDSAGAIELLDRGASANATNRPYVRITPRGALIDAWNRLRGIRPRPVEESYSPALLLVYGAVSFSPPDTSIVMYVNSWDYPPDFTEGHVRRSPATLVAALIGHGAVLHSKDDAGATLIAYACINDDAATLKILLDCHVTPSRTGRFGFSPLTLTEDYGCMKLLLDAGADPNGRDTGGGTPLMGATEPALYSLLIQHGADPNARDNDGQTALMHLFVSVYQRDENIYRGTALLLQRGARVSIRDHDGKTVLDYAKAGHANWMGDGYGKGPHKRSVVLMLEAALQRERASLRR